MRRPVALPPASLAWMPIKSSWSANPTSVGNGPNNAINPWPRTAMAWPGWDECWQP